MRFISLFLLFVILALFTVSYYHGYLAGAPAQNNSTISLPQESTDSGPTNMSQLIAPYDMPNVSPQNQPISPRDDAFHICPIERARACTAEYEPVCARIAAKNGEPLYFQDFYNPCFACSIASESVGYQYGTCLRDRN